MGYYKRIQSKTSEPHAIISLCWTIYARLFFPNVDTIIMVGLEPPGYFDPQNVSSEELSTYLCDLERSLFFPINKF